MEKNKDNDNVWTSMRNALEKLKEALKCVEDTFSGALEKQGEQNPVVTPKFRIGDIITPKGKKEYYTIIDIVDGWYEFREKHINGGIPIHYQFGWELVEQKHDDKVEPKFHEGDWIIHHGTENIYQVVVVIDNQYQLKYGDNYTIQNCAEVDRCARLWDAEKKELKRIEQKTVQETKPFEAEHGKYYYCIKDYFCGGKKQASKGDVVQALRGLPIMGLKDASEYFLPVNFIKCNPTWSEEDDYNLQCMIAKVDSDIQKGNVGRNNELIDWLKSLKDRVQPHWKPSDEQMEALKEAVDAEIVEVEDNNYSMCAYTHLEICTDEDLSKICKAGDKAKVIIIKQK